MRLDVCLVEMGFVPSRQKAKEYIEAGLVSIDERTIKKASYQYKGGNIELHVEHQYVSRAAYKLIAGLKQASFSVRDKICLDVGSSTGGFTEVLLLEGAKKVYAVDVGTDQLHERIRKDSKVISLENTDMRAVTKKEIPDPIDFFCIDVSFISQKLLLPSITPLVKKEAEFVSLVKPQFEVGKEKIGKSGIVKMEQDRMKAVQDVISFFEHEGYEVAGFIDSPITGSEGNKEYLVYGRKKGV